MQVLDSPSETRVSHLNHHVFPNKKSELSVQEMHCGQAEFHLPNELLLIIINNLAADTEDNDHIALAALASCRLASHFLCSLVTPLLFSSIELVDPSAVGWHRDPVIFKDRVTKSNQFLTRTTTHCHDIAASPHTLTLRCRDQDSITGTRISEILHRLPHIQHFTWKRIDVSPFITEFSSAIQTLCKSPNITTLDFGSIKNFPITVITACPNLRCLRLSCISFCVNSIFSVFSVIANLIFQFDNMNPMDETSSTHPFYLDSLQIDEFSLHSLGAISHQSFAKHFSQIKNLQLKNIVHEALFEWDIMLLSSQSLTTLDLSWNGSCKLLHCG
jgi:hypothetical protein